MSGALYLGGVMTGYQVNASWVTSINLLLANEIQDMSALKWVFLRLACTCEETCESVWPPNASLYASSTCAHLRLLAGPVRLAKAQVWGHIVCNGFLWDLVDSLNSARQIQIWRWLVCWIEKYEILLILHDTGKNVHRLCIIIATEVRFLLTKRLW